MTENEIQRQIFEWLILQGYLVMRINSGRMHSIPFARWQVLGLSVQSSGISDLLALDWDGQVYMIEAKLPGEKPTEQQKLFMAEAERRGAVCIVANSLENIKKQMGVVV